MNRKTVAERVSQCIRGEHYKNYMLPKKKIIKLSTERHVTVTYFPIANMIKDLLCNTTLMQAEILLISHVHNPCQRNNGSNAITFGEVNSGSWWQME